jgi:phosphomannomutase
MIEYFLMSNVPPEGIFKSYDIRGVYPDQINEENVVQSTRAIFAFFRQQLPNVEQLTVVVGRDMRSSSPVLFKAVTETLVELGAHVIDPGLVSTPTFYYAVFSGGYDSGIQITASHNPKQYNGLKIVINPKNGGLIKVGKPTGMEDIKKMAVEGVSVEPKGIGKITQIDNVTEDEVQNALKLTGNPKLNSYKVVADAANAMGALYIDHLYKHIPGELVKLYFELDGDFPNHAADPLDPKNNEDVEKKVVEEKADLGLALDGDGDRIFFLDEKGSVVPPSIITALVARELLREHKGEKVLFDIRYVMTPKKIVEEEGGETIVTRVGHAFITEQMNKSGGIFAGESSAHYFFKATGNAEGPLLVLLHILNVMTKTGKKLSELAADVKRSKESGEINFRVKNAQQIIDKLKELHADGEIIEIDGVSVQYPDWRFNLRMSNTEPILRLNVEETIDGYQGRHEKLIEIIKEHAEFDKESGH